MLLRCFVIAREAISAVHLLTETSLERALPSSSCQEFLYKLFYYKLKVSLLELNVFLVLQSRTLRRYTTASDQTEARNRDLRSPEVFAFEKDLEPLVIDELPQSLSMQARKERSHLVA